MRLTFHGVRGSSPVSGPDFERTGGHTSCVAVAVAADGDVATLVLDAGTGLQRLAATSGGRPFRGTILLTHLHWDHVHGLPFFAPADRDDAEVTLAQPAQGDPRAVLARSMSPPHFPIGPDQLRGRWTHVALEPGHHRFGGFDVTATEVAHKGGRAFGYRISADGVSCCYVPDAGDDNDEAILTLAANTDLLIRGAPFTSTQASQAAAFGHGTIEHSLAIAEQAGARRVVITHHGPFRTDVELEAIGRRLGVECVREGTVIELLAPSR